MSHSVNDLTKSAQVTDYIFICALARRNRLTPDIKSSLDNINELKFSNLKVNCVNTYNWMKRFLAVLGFSLIGLMLSTVAYAANPEPVVVGVEFVAPITISESTNLEFGLLDENMILNETVVIAPGGGVTDAAGRVVGGTQTAATFDTQAAALKPITIQVTSPISGTFYSLGTWTCDYNGGTIGDCGAGISETSAAGPGIVVRVGVTLTGAGGATAGVDDGSFDLTITYD